MRKFGKINLGKYFKKAANPCSTENLITDGSWLLYRNGSEIKESYTGFVYSKTQGLVYKSLHLDPSL